MPINEADIAKVAQLAHLELADEELKTFGPQITEIVNYVEQLNELDTANIEPALGGLTPEGEANRFLTRRLNLRLSGPKNRPRGSPRPSLRPLPRTKGALIFQTYVASKCRVCC